MCISFDTDCHERISLPSKNFQCISMDMLQIGALVFQGRLVEVTKKWQVLRDEPRSGSLVPVFFSSKREFSFELCHYLCYYLCRYDKNVGTLIHLVTLSSTSFHMVQPTSQQLEPCPMIKICPISVNLQCDRMVTNSGFKET